MFDGEKAEGETIVSLGNVAGRNYDRMGFDGGEGSSNVTKVGEGKYVGMTTMSGHGSERLDVANVWWDIEAIELDYEGNVIKETGISHLV